MISATKWLVPILLMALVGTAQAAAKEEKKPDKGSSTSDTSGTTITGKLVTFDRGALLVLVGDKGSDKVSVPTNADTKVTIEGKSSTLGQLRGGMDVSITGSNGVATEVTATLPKKKKKK